MRVAVMLSGHVALILGLVLGCTGCDGATLEDPQPQITHVGPIAMAGEHVEVTVSVYDREGDPVQLAISICLGDEQCGANECLPAVTSSSTRLRGNVTAGVLLQPRCEPDMTLDSRFSVCVGTPDGAALESSRVTLAELGFQSLQPCNR